MGQPRPRHQARGGGPSPSHDAPTKRPARPPPPPAGGRGGRPSRRGGRSGAPPTPSAARRSGDHRGKRMVVFELRHPVGAGGAGPCQKWPTSTATAAARAPVGQAERPASHASLPQPPHPPPPPRRQPRRASNSSRPGPPNAGAHRDEGHWPRLQAGRRSPRASRRLRWSSRSASSGAMPGWPSRRAAGGRGPPGRPGARRPTSRQNKGLPDCCSMSSMTSTRLASCAIAPADRAAICRSTVRGPPRRAPLPGLPWPATGRRPARCGNRPAAQTAASSGAEQPGLHGAAPSPPWTPTTQRRGHGDGPPAAGVHPRARRQHAGEPAPARGPGRRGRAQASCRRPRAACTGAGKRKAGRIADMDGAVEPAAQPASGIPQRPGTAARPPPSTQAQRHPTSAHQPPTAALILNAPPADARPRKTRIMPQTSTSSARHPADGPPASNKTACALALSPGCCRSRSSAWIPRWCIATWTSAPPSPAATSWPPAPPPDRHRHARRACSAAPLLRRRAEADGRDHRPPGASAAGGRPTILLILQGAARRRLSGTAPMPTRTAPRDRRRSRLARRLAGAPRRTGPPRRPPPGCSPRRPAHPAGAEITWQRLPANRSWPATLRPRARAAADTQPQVQPCPSAFCPGRPRGAACAHRPGASAPCFCCTRASWMKWRALRVSLNTASVITPLIAAVDALRGLPTDCLEYLDSEGSGGPPPSAKGASSPPPSSPKRPGAVVSTSANAATARRNWADLAEVDMPRRGCVK